MDSASSHELFTYDFSMYVYPTTIEQPRTIPHRGHWGHITLPTYIQSLLIYIYYSLASLIYCASRVRRAENRNVNLHKLKIMERNRRQQSIRSKNLQKEILMSPCTLEKLAVLSICNSSFVRYDQTRLNRPLFMAIRLLDYWVPSFQVSCFKVKSNERL